MKNTLFWYYFLDGHKICVKGFSRREIAAQEVKHGKLIRMVAA